MPLCVMHTPNGGGHESRRISCWWQTKGRAEKLIPPKYRPTVILQLTRGNKSYDDWNQNGTSRRSGQNLKIMFFSLLIITSSLFSISFSSFNTEELSMIKYGLEISKEPVSLEDLRKTEHEDVCFLLFHFL